VCGLFRPVILLPRSLVGQLSPEQMRAVLLHELFHFRRGDVWVNCFQALLQAVYWWHPFVWVANARTRRAREEAVDDAVMGALREEAEIYAPTLLQVARLALNRPHVTLGLVGILESKAALRQRLERLVNFRAPRTAGLTLFSLAGMLVFAATALPMGAGPARQSATPQTEQTVTRPWPDPRFQGYAKLDLQAQFFFADAVNVRDVLSTDARTPLILSSNELDNIRRSLRVAGAEPSSDGQLVGFEQFSGGRFQYQIGGCTNSAINYLTRGEQGKTTVLGAQAQYVATAADWVPLQFTLQPWMEGDGLLCHAQLAFNDDSNSTRQAVVTIPRGGAMLWAISRGAATGKCQIVLLQHVGAATEPAAASNLRGPPSADEHSKDGKPKQQTAKDLKHSQALASGVDTNSAGEQPDNAERDLNAPKAPLYLRGIKVDPNTFGQCLEAVTGQLSGLPGSTAIQTDKVIPSADGLTHSGLAPVPRTNDMAAQGLRMFFQNLGVNLDPPKSVFYNDREGTLLVRATLQDLDTIEKTLQVLMVRPAQINIKAKFIEMPAEDAAAFWQAFLIDAPTNGARTVILNPFKMKEQLKQWQAAPNVKLLAETRVTTLSGRRCQIQVADDWVAKTGAASLQLASTNREIFLDPCLDVLPELQADGSTIHLTLVPSVTEFLGFDNPGEFSTDIDASEWSQHRSPTGDLPLAPPQNSLPRAVRPAAVRLPLPHFRIRQVTTTAIAHDGQTVVVGGLSPANSNSETRAVPVFGGDIPILARLFQKSTNGTPSKALVILVTPVLIDPAGNRLHSDHEAEKGGK
jgi:hypothetical protein